MPEQKLHFNIIPFSFPQEVQIFYFTLEKDEKSTRIHHTLFPNNIEEIFPGITSDGTKFIYTSFGFPKENYTPLLIDFSNENEDFIRKYYHSRINYYFKKIKLRLVRRDFVGQNQIWIKSTTLSTNEYLVFHKFTLKIQFYDVSLFPELVITYDGKARILTTAVANITKEISPSLLTWVTQNKVLYNFEVLKKKGNVDFAKIFPVLNNPITTHLEIKLPENKKENKYKTYKRNVEIFYDTFINVAEFKGIIDIHDGGFMQVENHLIDEVDDNSNLLEFSDKQTGRTPKTEFKWKKPFKPVIDDVHVFFIYHGDDINSKNLFQSYLENGFTKAYPGLTQFANIVFHIEQTRNICFINREDPTLEVEQFFGKNPPLNKSLKYLALYITPHSKEETSKKAIRPYVRIKEFLLHKNIACQSVEPKTINAPNDDFRWSLTTMSVSILAKLGGIPWRLVTAKDNHELIVGIGSFKHPDGVQYISSAVCFDFSGLFNEFDYFLKHQTDLIAGSIEHKIGQFVSKYGNPKRLIIHFYKEKMKKKEIAPIEEALRKLQLSIPIFIIHVNKTEAKDIIAYDGFWENKWMPYSGTFISISEHKYLLFNNSRHPTEKFYDAEGFPFPIKLSIDCNDKSQLKQKLVIKELINQVYQFSRIYFKSLTQQNLPVTVKYTEFIAQFVPFMAKPDLPSTSKNHLWFL